MNISFRLFKEMRGTKSLVKEAPYPTQTLKKINI
jgi:hypothetical protein